MKKSRFGLTSLIQKIVAKGDGGERRTVVNFSQTIIFGSLIENNYLSYFETIRTFIAFKKKKVKYQTKFV